MTPMTQCSAPLQILVVDDDPISAAILQAYLTDAGHQACCADSAAAAMYSLQHEVMAAQDIPIQGIGREAFRS